MASRRAERAFSIMGTLKSKSRSNMDYDILEGYMRIKMNAAKSVREFPAIIYSKKWSLNHKLADDPCPKKTTSR